MKASTAYRKAKAEVKKWQQGLAQENHSPYLWERFQKAKAALMEAEKKFKGTQTKLNLNGRH